MKASNALAILAFAASRMLFSGSKKLTWETVQGWVESNGNIEDLGRGFAGERLRRRSSNAYADIHRERTNSGKMHVTASIVFDARQGSAITKTWDADKLDSKLEKKFGDNQRFRVSL